MSELSRWYGVHQPPKRFGPILTKDYPGIRTKPNGKANQRASALIRIRSGVFVSFGLLFELIRSRPVSSAFEERSKRRRTFAQNVYVFGKEEWSLRSTAGPYSCFVSKSSRCLLRNPKRSFV